MPDTRFTPDALIERLAGAVATGPMKIVADGGGIEKPFTFGFDHALLVSRGDVEYALELLRAKYVASPPELSVEPIRVGSEAM